MTIEENQHNHVPVDPVDVASSDADVSADTSSPLPETAANETTSVDAPTDTDVATSESRDMVEMQEVTLEVGEVKRALEAVLLAAAEPMPLNELKRIFDGQVSVDTIRALLDEVRADWAERSVELAVVASGYRFRVKPEYQKYLDRLSNDKPLKYSRAVLETLAIIAYRQPVTRGDIEDIRGVAVSPHILKTLEDRGWIDEIGHRETVGRPVLFATTKHFLDDLNLRSLEELPPLHELQATLDMSQAGALLGASLPSTVPLDLAGLASEASSEASSDAEVGSDVAVDAPMEDSANNDTADIATPAGDDADTSAKEPV
jgi:segregation and condensation protein B